MAQCIKSEQFCHSDMAFGLLCNVNSTTAKSGLCSLVGWFGGVGKMECW